MIINRIISGLLVVCVISYPVEAGGSDRILDIKTEHIAVKALNIDVTDKIRSTYQEPVDNTKKLTNDEVDLISRVVMAEAEDEPLEGKIYVIDTILNRVDSKHFPNTVHDVIYQKSQFTSMWNGRFNRCTSNSELNNIINEEYSNRKNSDIVFFTADQYGKYGKPSFRVAHHYFSTYN